MGLEINTDLCALRAGMKASKVLSGLRNLEDEGLVTPPA